jgi:mannosyl-3-phosphoglycerate synthase
MRIERPKDVERFGAVRFGTLQKIFELDSGMENGDPAAYSSVIQPISTADLHDVEQEMAIIVPVKNERLKLIEGVLCGIPHPCLIIVVSNSPREPFDRFGMEEDALQEFCAFTRKRAMIVHQKDPAFARLFEKVDYRTILDENGQVRDGKAEGMIIGMLLAKLAGKRYVGFVDADNYFPGAVEEYVRAYAAGFAMSTSPYTMVRIAWHSKPKIVESKLFFRKWGRTSTNTNAFLNKLLAHYTGFETEIVKTGNAGEHAMTMELALNLNYASGYAIEPYHIINLIERFGGVNEMSMTEIMQHHKIEVYQVESRNPHLHEAGDEDHIDQMSYLAMQAIYHSAVCPEGLKAELYQKMIDMAFINDGEEPQQPYYFPPLSKIDTDLFTHYLGENPFVRQMGGQTIEKLNLQ